MAGENGAPTKMVTLISSDDTRFEVPEAAATLSQTVRRLIEEDASCAAAGIPLPNVDATILAKVIEYCNKHAPTPNLDAAAAAGERDLESFDREFVNVDTTTLTSIVIAADYLKIMGLVDLTCKTIADMIRGKTPEEIKRVFKINSEFTAEEEEEIRRENAWAYE